jgi:hypothetical protein
MRIGKRRTVFIWGILNIWPEHWTQGKPLAELEEILPGLYEIYCEENGERNIEKKTEHLKAAIA